MPWCSAVSASSAERVGLLLLHRRRCVGAPAPAARRRWYRVSRAASSALQEQGADLRGQSAPDRHHAVFVLVHVQRARRCAGEWPPAPRRFGPPSRQPRTMRSTCSRGAGAAHRQQPLLGLRRGHAGQRAHLGVRELAAGERLRQPRQRRRARARPGRARGPRPGRDPTRQVSQAAHERKPLFQPPRASNSRMRSSRRAVAASRCADSSAISSPSRSRSRSDEEFCMASPPSAAATLHPGFRATSETLRAAIATQSPFLTTPSPDSQQASMGPLRPRPQCAGDTRRKPAQKSVKCENSNTVESGGAHAGESGSAPPELRQELGRRPRRPARAGRRRRNAERSATAPASIQRWSHSTHPSIGPAYGRLARQDGLRRRRVVASRGSLSSRCSAAARFASSASVT